MELSQQAVAEDVFRSQERVAVPPVLQSKRFTQVSVGANDPNIRHAQHRNDSTVPTSNASFEVQDGHALTSRINNQNSITNKKDSIFNHIENPIQSQTTLEKSKAN